jgi:predicted TPR repeat methyltransferase
MTSKPSLKPDYFDAIYQRDPDPWQFATSEYEAGKYRATLAALPRKHYRNGFEVGCSIGVLTRMLAERCDDLLAVDVSDGALAQAKEHCRDKANIGFARMQVPDELPEAVFDLIVLSEVAYYWAMPDLDRMIAWTSEHCADGGTVILVHWILDTDYPLTGDQVHDRFLAAPGLACVTDRREARYRLSVLAPRKSR